MKNSSVTPTGSLPSCFHVIERHPDARLYWHQARCEWVGLLDADHYPDEASARELIRHQPHMHQFFKAAVLQRFNLSPAADCAGTPLL